jgi:putative transposase
VERKEFTMARSRSAYPPEFREQMVALVRSGDRFDPRQAFEFMGANQATIPITTMCQVLGVSPSGYYAWCARPQSARTVAHQRLLERMRAIYTFSREIYGGPRMVAELRDEGWLVNHKRVGRLMKLEGLVGLTRRKKWRTTKRDRDARPAPDLVERDFAVKAPDRLWVADITYIPTWGGFLYLAVGVDAWSRRIVGWAMETHLRTELVLQALNMALWQRKPDAVIHHFVATTP